MPVNEVALALIAGIAVGAYVTYYGIYELRLFLLSASARDPIVQGVGRFQNTLTQLVAALGPWPFAALLATARGALALNRRRRKAIRPDRR